MTNARPVRYDTYLVKSHVINRDSDGNPPTK